MNIPIELLLAGASGLFLLSVFLSKASEKLGVPALLLFLGIGMLAGSDGPGGIYFDNAFIAQTIGTVALAFILFAGGLDTDWQQVRPVLRHGISLATLGVGLTAFILGAFAHVVLGFPWLQALLVGAIVSSTDAAAVFSVLRSRNVSLRGNLRPLLEFESGSNDPMAVFLTIGILGLIGSPGKPFVSLLPLFFLQMGIGLIIGFAGGLLSVALLNRLRLEYEGLYPVLTASLVIFTYGLTAYLSGSGFLAVYVAGLVIGNRSFVRKKTLIQFHDGLAWIMQITMFLTLGLLVFPKQLPDVAGKGLILSAVLILVARPIAVFLSSLIAGMPFREKLLISWVGLRGAVPIVLATFPFLAGIDQDRTIFNVIFFVVLTSVLIQGPTIPLFAKLLKADAPMERKRRYPLEFLETEGADMQLTEIIVPYESRMVGKSLIQVGMPKTALIVLIVRGESYIVPSGDSVLEEGDVLLTLGDKESLKDVSARLGGSKESA